MRLDVENIGIIKDAKVELNGITVIAGENGTGKSTIGKTLYSIVYSILNCNSEYIQAILDELDSILRTMYVNHRRSSGEESTISRFKLQILRSKVRNTYSKINEIASVINLLREIEKELTNLSLVKEKLTQFEMLKYNVSKNIKVEELFKNAFQRLLVSEFNNEFITCNKKRAKIHFSDSNHIIIDATIHKGLQSSKNNIDISQIDEIFTSNVCYIESPLVLDMINYSDIATGRVMHLLKLLKMNPSFDIDLFSSELFDNVENGDKIVNQLNTVINGSVKYNSDSFNFEFKQNNNTFKLANVAMGIKSFGTIELLIRNKNINKDSILIIDEPEVHLHPKWQIEYAKLIVQISKIGCKVILATHSPFMVQALYKFSNENKIPSNFYLTESTEKDLYRIEDCTNNISRIFSRLSEPLSELVWRAE